MSLACLMVVFTSGGLGPVPGGPSSSHFTVDAASPPVAAIYAVGYTGLCPVAAHLWCNATASPPVVGTATWTDEASIVNPAQAAAWPGTYIGSIDAVGGYQTAAVHLAPGSHLATAQWGQSIAWSGLVSVYASSPCPALKFSEIWLNTTAELQVHSPAGTVVSTTITPTSLAFVNVHTSATSCVPSTYFAALYGKTVNLLAGFTTVAPGNYYDTTTITVTATVAYTQDSCAIFGVNWGTPGAWPWGYPAYCPPIGTLSAPALPPPFPTSGDTLLSSTIT
ncbi:MAG: hypothetical protein L3K17_01915 [Thermoplasmata archaeon]|nr:hypothetical protein [Thermoplasmata archaeon]